MKPRNFWKSWQSEINIEWEREIRGKVAKDPVSSPALRTSRPSKDWPQNSNSVTIFGLGDSIGSQTRDADRNGGKAGRIGGDSRCDDWTVEREQAVRERKPLANIGTNSRGETLRPLVASSIRFTQNALNERCCTTIPTELTLD